MSIDISSKLLLVPVGVDASSHILELSEDNYNGDFYRALSDLNLSLASPWFDASCDDSVIGIELKSPLYEDLLDQESKWWDSLNSAKDLLTRIFGESECKLVSCPHVY